MRFFGGPESRNFPFFFLKKIRYEKSRDFLGLGLFSSEIPKFKEILSYSLFKIETLQWYKREKNKQKIPTYKYTNFDVFGLKSKRFAVQYCKSSDLKLREISNNSLKILKCKHTSIPPKSHLWSNPTLKFLNKIKKSRASLDNNSFK